MFRRCFDNQGGGVKMTRAEILDAAKKCVCGQREQDYGTPESNFQLIADLWNAYLYQDFKTVISATDVAMMMALMKIARIKNGGGTGDSFVDLAGYAACGGEINAAEKEDHVNTEVKRRSGRYPWGESDNAVNKTIHKQEFPNEESLHEDSIKGRYCVNCKWQDEKSYGKHCNMCSHNEIESKESHWENKDLDKTIKAQKFSNEESTREDYSLKRYCVNCKWQDEKYDGKHCDWCSHIKIESKESHWEKEELPHTCMTCKHNSKKENEDPCCTCMEYDNWEEIE